MLAETIGSKFDKAFCIKVPDGDVAFIGIEVHRRIGVQNVVTTFTEDPRLPFIDV